MITSYSLALPPLIVLIICSWLLLKSDKRKLFKENKQLSCFLGGIAGLNTIELLTYTGLLNPSLILMKLYYVFMIITLTSILVLSIKICNIEQLSILKKEICAFLFFVSCVYIFTIVSTNWIIEDIQLTSYSLTRVPGKYYFLIQYLFIALSIPILVLLIIGSSWKNVDENVKRSRVILSSFSPLLISLLGVLALMEAGVPVNASLVLPLGSTILLTVIINTERKEDLFKLLIKIPYTKENSDYKKITNEIESFLTSARCGEESSLKTLTSKLEQHIVSMAVEMANGSQVKAAVLLNTSTSSICRKIRA